MSVQILDTNTLKVVELPQSFLGTKCSVHWRFTRILSGVVAGVGGLEKEGVNCP